MKAFELVMLEKKLHVMMMVFVIVLHNIGVEGYFWHIASSLSSGHELNSSIPPSTFIYTFHKKLLWKIATKFFHTTKESFKA